jgi:hypothetical protein
MAGFQQGRIARVQCPRQSKKLMQGIKEIYPARNQSEFALRHKINKTLLDFQRNDIALAFGGFAIV